MAAQVAIKKNDHSHKLDDITGSNHSFTDNLFKTAFGNEGLGRSLLGSRGNVPNLSSYTIQKFQLDNIHPSKITVAAVGIDSHTEFFDLVNEKLGYLVANPTTSVRPTAQFHGGELRAIAESGLLTVALGWEGGSYCSKDGLALQLAAEMLQGGALKGLVASSSLVESA